MDFISLQTLLFSFSAWNIISLYENISFLIFSLLNSMGSDLTSKTWLPGSVWPIHMLYKLDCLILLESQTTKMGIILEQQLNIPPWEHWHRWQKCSSAGHWGVPQDCLSYTHWYNLELKSPKNPILKAWPTDYVAIERVKPLIGRTIWKEAKPPEACLEEHI